MKALKKLYWLVSFQFGFDPLRLFKSLRGIPRFVYDLWKFSKSYSGNISITPCLHDRYNEGGTTKSEYFWQDLVVARFIFSAAPEKHVDIGSRVDGFVAHIASFRDIEVLDVRPTTTVIPGVVFRESDLMNPASLPSMTDGGYCDSLSCLHALEHFGLGRYNDPINPNGCQQGIANMAKLLRTGGVFYLSTPIGKERVEFNANWVFDPRTIIEYAASSGLTLRELAVITPDHGAQSVSLEEASLLELAAETYQLGLFIFMKITEDRKQHGD